MFFSDFVGIWVVLFETVLGLFLFLQDKKKIRKNSLLNFIWVLIFFFFGFKELLVNLKR